MHQMRAAVVLFCVCYSQVYAIGPVVAAVPAGQGQAQPLPAYLMSAEACSNETELCAWHEYAASHMGLVPGAFREFPLADLEHKFSARLVELLAAQNKTAPAAEMQTVAIVCKSRSNGHQGAAGRAAVPESAASSLAPRRVDFHQCTDMRLPVDLPHLRELPMMLATALLCKDEEDVRTWHDCQHAEILAVVPEPHKGLAMESADVQFRERLAQFQKPDLPDGPWPHLPVFLVTSSACKSVPELQAWRDAHIAQVTNFVPPEFREGAFGAVQDRYKKRLAEIQGPQMSLRERSALQNPTDTSNAAPLRSVSPPVQPKSEAQPAQALSAGNEQHGNAAGAADPAPVEAHTVGGNLLVATGLFVLAGMLLPAFIAGSSSAWRTKRRVLFLDSESGQAGPRSEFHLMDVGPR
mmetsp:Transcript_41282/g.95017  ORF Transcript_41282/g.95017 Transcript_41282/m.95017 type:complete len:409 (-) Transcript_41282:179-1405(-)